VVRDGLLRRASSGTVVTVLRAPTSTQEGLETAEEFRCGVLFFVLCVELCLLGYAYRTFGACGYRLN
jgi:hypothetical protein